MERTRKRVIIVVLCVLLSSCTANRHVNDFAFAVVALPFKVVVAAVAAAIGAASGMGMLPDESSQSLEKYLSNSNG